MTVVLFVTSISETIYCPAKVVFVTDLESPLLLIRESHGTHNCCVLRQGVPMDWRQR